MIQSSHLGSFGQQLETWLELPHTLAQAQGVRDILSLYLSSLNKSLTTISRAIIFLYDSLEDCLVAKAAEGYDLTALKSIHFAPMEGMIGGTLSSRRGRLYPDSASILAASQNLTPAQRDVLQSSVQDKSQTQSAACLPLILGENKIGVLFIESLNPSMHLTESHLVFLLLRHTDIVG